MWMLVLAIVIGSLLPVQAKMNGMLFNASQSMLLSGFLSVVITLVFLSVVFVAKGESLYLPKASIWAYMGGIIGGTYIVTISYMAAKASMTTIMIGLFGGQMVSSLILDYAASGMIEWRKIAAGILVFFALGLCK